MSFRVNSLRKVAVLVAITSFLRTRVSLLGPKPGTSLGRLAHELARAFDRISLLIFRICFDSASLVVLLIGVTPYRILKSIISTPKDKTTQFKTILITGSSAGIGAGLAQRYAAPGTTLHLLAYNDPELEKIAERCRDQGSIVETYDADVRNQDLIRSIVDNIERRSCIDLVIANAGIAPKRCGIEEAHLVFDVNVMGVMNTVLPVLQYMRARKRGQIALMSSLGGYAPATNRYMASYVATKTAIRAFGEGLRNSLSSEGIGVTVVCPGFTKSKMTDYLIAKGCKLYGLWNNAKATAYMKDGIDSNYPEVAFPLSLYIISRLVGNMPDWQRDLMLPMLRVGDPFMVMDNNVREE